MGFPCGRHSSPVGPLLPLLLAIFTTTELCQNSAGECEPSQSCCQLQICWDLFQSAQESLGVRTVLPQRRHTLTPEELHVKCISLRTFHTCINTTRNRGCLGDLSFHSAHKGVERQMKQFNCSFTGPVYTPNPHPPPSDGDRPEVCSYTGRPVYRHCGLFGDPHLRTFNEEFETCKVAGAWPLIDNEYFTVQVTNDPVGVWDGTATATSKLTVVIKRNDECGPFERFVTYQAQTDHLPSTFDNRRTHFGPEKSVRIEEKEAGSHIEIYLRYIDTTLVVRQIGRYFTFAAKMPEEIVNTSAELDPDNIQLCVKGCPNNERINFREFLTLKSSRLKDNINERSPKTMAMDRDRAVEKCRRAGVVDFYFDSCVFDLMTTGDRNFTLAAYTALQDVLRLHPTAARMHRNRTSLDEYDRGYTSGATRWHQHNPWTVAALVFLTLWTVCHQYHHQLPSS